MPLDAEIIVKCPACDHKFRARREEDAVIVPCPECGLQIKLSSIGESRKKSQKFPSIGALPDRHPGSGNVIFEDLARDRSRSRRARSRREGGAGHRAGRSSTRVQEEWEESLPVVDKSYDELLEEGKKWKTRKIAQEAQEELLWGLGGEGGHRKKGSSRRRSIFGLPRLVVVLACVCIVVLAAVLYALIRSKGSDPEPEVGHTPTMLRPRESIRDRFDLAKPFIYKFLQSDTLEKRLRYVREPRRVAPLMRKFYGGENLDPISIKHLGPADFCTVDSGFLLVPIWVEGEEFERGIAVTFEGEMLIDWESFAGYSELSLAAFRAQKPTSDTLLRVEMSKDDYYNYQFSDRDLFECFEVRDLAGEKLWGYVRRDARHLAAALAAANVQGHNLLQGSVLAVLRGRYPEDAANDSQFQITEVVTLGWILEDGR